MGKFTSLIKFKFFVLYPQSSMTIAILAFLTLGLGGMTLRRKRKNINTD
ncbi:MAG: LPXTG cell wall anchor domain-containing protein [Candidatus Omnitrophica bacterium]|nr:LPXTG cell wall anchor domain-containing protein [Candidatus Omnitrophota bacterium]